MTGELLDAPFPSVRDAMVDGVIGVDGILAITGSAAADRAAGVAAARPTADIVVAEARGEGPDGAPPACAELLRIHAQTGSSPSIRTAPSPRARRRAQALVRARWPTADGVPVRGTLLPEVAAQLQTIFDAHLAPTVAFDDPFAVDEDGEPRLPAVDDRTRAQKQHDALAAALGVAASSGLLPTIGGHAPTSSSRSTRKTSPRVPATRTRRAAISPSAAASPGTSRARESSSASPAAPTGGSSRSARRSASSTGTSAARSPCATAVHHPRLRRAGRVVRDPPRHRTRPRRPTHTDNGVLLCWYHHRFLDRIGWQIRMNAGFPRSKPHRGTAPITAGARSPPRG
jgi:hypothetical protein